MKGLYKFNFDCGRMGNLTGMFVEESELVDTLINSGVEVYFGEVLGKHSEIYDKVEQKDITLVTTDTLAIDIILTHDLETGYNPFDYEVVNQDKECSVREYCEQYIKNNING